MTKIVLWGYFGVNQVFGGSTVETVIFELNGLKAVKIETGSFDEGETAYRLFDQGKKVYGITFHNWACSPYEIESGCVNLLLSIFERIASFDARLVSVQDLYGIERMLLLFPGQEKTGTVIETITIDKSNAEKAAFEWYTHGNWARVDNLMGGKRVASAA